MKRWPHEAQSGGWCPPPSGSERPGRFNFGRDRRHDDVSAQPRSLIPADPVAWAGASLDERTGVSKHSPAATAAADAQEGFSLDTSFLRS
jgi:hypothetical protein